MDMHGTLKTPWAVSFEVGGGKNIPGIPGACATSDFSYLVTGPLDTLMDKQTLSSWQIYEPWAGTSNHIPQKLKGVITPCP